MTPEAFIDFIEEEQPSLLKYIDTPHGTFNMGLRLLSARVLFPFSDSEMLGTTLVRLQTHIRNRST